MPRATRWVAVLVGTVVSVSACTGGGPEPGPSSDDADNDSPLNRRQSPSTDTHGRPAEPAKPSELDHRPATQAAVDAAAYFMDLYNYVIATGDLTGVGRALRPRVRVLCQHT